MKRIINLTIWLVFLAWSAYSQTPTGNVLPMSSGAKMIGLWTDRWKVVCTDSLWLTYGLNPTMIGWTSSYRSVTDAQISAWNGLVSFPGFGTSGSTACVGNDSRLSDARTPTAHTQAWSTITSTPTTRSGYGITDAAASTHSHPESEVTNLVTDLGNKQATLVSGTNIKTVNGNTLLGSGDVAISGSAAWGSITGTLSNQTDVYNSLNSKEPSLGIPASDGYVLSSTIGGTRSWIAPGGGGGVDMATIVDLIRVKPFLYTDFLGVAGATTVEAAYPFDYAVISSGTQAKIAGEQNHPGILRTSSSTTTNSGGYCIIEGTAFRLTGGEVFELTFQHRVASGTATTLRFGFLDNTTSSDAVDGCYFECPAASLALVGKTSSNSTRSTTATIYTLTVNTWYRAKVVVNSNATSVTFYLYNDAGSLLGSQSLTTNIPTASGRETGAGFVATNSGTTATLLAYWDWMALWFNDRALVR